MVGVVRELAGVLCGGVIGWNDRIGEHLNIDEKGVENGVDVLDLGVWCVGVPLSEGVEVLCEGFEFVL